METSVLDQLSADELKAKLKETGAKLYEYRNAATVAKEVRENAEDEWRNQPSVKEVFEAEKQAASVRDQAETNIRLMQTRLYELTGEKNPDPAFQVRIVEKPVYEADKVTDWLLDMVRGLMTLNKTAVNAWLKEVADPSGNMPVWFQKPIPAIVISEPTTAIVSVGLERLAYKPTVPEVIKELDALESTGDRLTAKPVPVVVDTTPVSVPVKLDWNANDIQLTQAFDTEIERQLDEAGKRFNELLEQDAKRPEPVADAVVIDLSDIPF